MSIGNSGREAKHWACANCFRSRKPTAPRHFVFAIRGRIAGRLRRRIEFFQIVSSSSWERTVRLQEGDRPVAPIAFLITGERPQPVYSSLHPIGGQSMTDKPLEQMGLRDLRGIMRQQGAGGGVDAFQRRSRDQVDLSPQSAGVSAILISPENFPRCQRAGYFRRVVRQDVADSGDHGASGEF